MINGKMMYLMNDVFIVKKLRNVLQSINY